MNNPNLSTIEILMWKKFLNGPWEGSIHERKLLIDI